MILSFTSVIFAQNLPTFVDSFLYDFNSSVKTPDTSLNANANFASVYGGQVDYYIYQYPLIPGSDATDGAAVTIETSSPTNGRRYGRTSFSVDAAIYGFAMQVYDGNDTTAGNGNPCGSITTHLDDDVACAGGLGLASPGLQLNLASKNYFATEILSQDIPSGANMIIRVWDNSGHTGYMNYIHPFTVSQPAQPLNPYKPLLFFPFTSFTNGPSIDWSNIKAIAVEYNSTIASVDLVIGPIQALGSSISKTSTTPQPIQPNQQVNFKVNVSPDIYQTNIQSQLLSPIYHNVTVVDTLPSEFIGFNTSTISAADQNGTNVVVQTTISGNTATFRFSFSNSQLVTLSYTGILPSTFNFCSKSVCNNAAVTLLTTSGTMSTSKTSTVSACVNLTSTPSISTTYTTCPNTFSNILQYNASVCNNGNGLATNVNFSHTSSNSLSGCTINFPSATCNGATCSTNLGNLSVGQCTNVAFSYNCTSFAQTCSPLTFSSATLVNENCVNSSSSNSCSFTFSPSSSNVVINSTCPQNLSPSNTNTQHQSTVCNNGAGIARNVVYQYNGSGALVNCTLNILSGTCSGVNCSRNLGDLSAGQCVNVAVNISCPSYAQTCTNVNFPSTYYTTDTCNGATPTQTCSFSLNPGTPTVTITNTCPQNLSPSNTTTQLSSNVCNNGTGIARNVVYTHTPSGALVNCTATLSSGTCNGASCTRNLGDLAVGQCVNVVVGLSCPSYAQTCTNVNFPSTVSATEGCGTSVTNQTCSFSLNPGTPTVTITNTCPQNLSPSNTTTQLSSNVCNNGTGIARNVVYTHTPSGALVNCTATLSSGTCSGASCTRNLGDLAVGQCVNVVVGFSCPSYAQTCTNVNFPSTVSATEGCGTSVTNQTCSFSLNPGTPAVTITNTCPSRFLLNDTTGSITSNVCNNGTGIARNVNYTYTPQSSMTSCTYNLVGGTCNGASCTRNLGDLAVGQCVTTTINYNCSTFSQTCSLVQFSNSFAAVEGCGTTVQPTTCNWNLNPGLASLNSTSNVCPPSLSESNTTINFSAKVCNQGNGVARNVVFKQDAYDDLTQCTVVFPTGTCSGNSCTKNIGTLQPGECQNVDVSYNCSVFAKTCTPKHFFANYTFTETCSNSTTSNSHCTVVLGPGTSNITTSFLSCPTLNSNLQASSVSHICNNGTGKARNVVFTHTLDSILSQCTASISNGTCSGSTCSSNLGDVLAGQCLDITVNYNCGLFAGDCLVHSFSANSLVNEDCGSTSQQSTCTFSTNPSLAVSVSETLLNTVPARTNQVVTWNVTGTNVGNSTSKTFSIIKSYPNYTSPTSETLSVWSCGANNICTYNGSSLLSGKSVNLLFAVTVLPTIPLSTTQVCNSILMVTLPNQNNCYSQATTTGCAPVDPNVPDLVLKKSVYTSQYTFKIKYTNIGTGPVNNLVLSDQLQQGWSINSKAAAAGWSCSGSSCSQTIPNVPYAQGGNSGTSLFIVDVNPLFQTLSNGSLQCWTNFVNSTFDDVQFDKTPENNYATSPPIGSYCQHCCEPEPCPPANCTLTCPPTQLDINCPPVSCKCDIPEQWCPTCKKITPPCDCNQCNTNGVVYA